MSCRRIFFQVGMVVIVLAFVCLCGCNSSSLLSIPNGSQYVANVKVDGVAVVKPAMVDPEIHRISGMMDNVDKDKVGYIKRLKNSNLTSMFAEYIKDSEIFIDVYALDDIASARTVAHELFFLELEVTELKWYPKDAKLKTGVAAVMGATVVALPGVLVLPVDGELKIEVKLTISDASGKISEILRVSNQKHLEYCAINMNDVWDREESVLFSECFKELVAKIEQLNIG